MDKAATEVSDEELKSVIADFLEMGHVENIVSMFKRENHYYEWVGEILIDERINVRLGLAILFEDLALLQPEALQLAIPSLKKVLEEAEPLYRGEALSLLGTVGSEEARHLIRLYVDDDDQQVREMVALLLEEFDE